MTIRLPQPDGHYRRCGAIAASGAISKMRVITMRARHFKPDDGLIYGQFGERIPISAKSLTKIFFRTEREARSISRPAFDKNGKAKDAGEWFFATEGAALAYAARRREKERERGRAWKSVRPAAKPLKLDVNASEVRRLRLEAADAHPDKGGSSEKFIKAHARYIAAKRACEARP
jgi:hypothetical protein